jgi:SEC-C motif
MITVSPIHQETPAEITLMIRDALRQISTSTPFFIDITPLPDCDPMFCYQNVDECIRREGGTREEGWIVYKGWGGRYLKLIHHCLWRSPDGRLVDVTPSDEVHNLFLPDTVRNNGEGVPSRYFALYATPEVAETIAVCEDMDRQQMEMFRLLLGWEDNRSLRLGSASLTRQYQSPNQKRCAGRNDPCPCGSGKKFKRCCLRHD